MQRLCNVLCKNLVTSVWGQPGNWHSLAAQKVDMKSDKESLISVSRAAMRLPEVPRITGRADDEPAGAPPGAGNQDEEDVWTYDKPS